MATPLSAILLDAKDLSDLLNNTVVVDTTWRRWANQAQERLWRLLVVKSPARFHKTVSFTLTGAGGNTTALAADFRQMREGGVTRNPTVQASRLTLRRFNFGERDAQGVIPPWGWARDLAYDIQASNIVVEPAGICAGNYAYYYLAGPIAWATDGSGDSVNIDAIYEPYVDYIAHWMAIKGAMKDESMELANQLKADLVDLRDEIQTTFNEASDPTTIIDVNQVGGYLWR